MLTPGAVVWITGLPGSGKTTVSNLVAQHLARDGVLPVLLDGDRMRAVLPAPVGYDEQARRQLASYYGRLALELSNQGHLVLCATVSLFQVTHAWNRAHLPRYLEVWLRAPVDQLRARDGKGIYSAAERPGDPFAGLGVQPEFPRGADLVIDNHHPVSAQDAADTVLTLVRDRI
jgi:adenylylsulfate kinase-like enzyme